MKLLLVQLVNASFEMRHCTFCMLLNCSMQKAMVFLIMCRDPPWIIHRHIYQCHVLNNNISHYHGNQVLSGMWYLSYHALGLNVMYNLYTTIKCDAKCYPLSAFSLS